MLQVAASQDKDKLQELLATAASAEQELRRQALEITFLIPDETEPQLNGSLADATRSIDCDEDGVEEAECFGEQLEQEGALLGEGCVGDGQQQEEEQQQQRQGSRRDKVGKVQRGPARMAAKLGLPLKR